jgi:RNase H-fold protein (predicted Holliday junction resolvase)
VFKKSQASKQDGGLDSASARLILEQYFLERLSSK